MVLLGILKIKDHVENPSQTPLQHGAIRLTAGGGLFALPIVYEAMQNTIGSGGNENVADPLQSIGNGLVGGGGGVTEADIPLEAFGGE